MERYPSRLFRIGFDATRGAAIGGAEVVMPFDRAHSRASPLARDGIAAFDVETADANLVVNRACTRWRDWTRPLSAWVIDDDGTDRARPVPDGPSGSPTWSRNGRVLPSRGDREDAALWWVDVASRRATVSAISGSDIRSARLSPDSREIACHAIETSDAMPVWTQPRDGGRRVRLTTDREAISYPVWSTDGKSLAAEMKRGERTNIGVMGRDGGPIEPLTDEPGQSWPDRWSPNSGRIAYAADRGAVWNIWQVSRRRRATCQLTYFTSSSG